MVGSRTYLSAAFLTMLELRRKKWYISWPLYARHWVGPYRCFPAAPGAVGNWLSTIITKQSHPWYNRGKYRLLREAWKAVTNNYYLGGWRRATTELFWEWRHSRVIRMDRKQQGWTQPMWLELGVYGREEGLRHGHRERTVNDAYAVLPSIDFSL